MYMHASSHPSYNLTMVLTFGPGRRLSTWPTTAVSCPTALLQSADVSTCVVPWTLSSYGNRTFEATGGTLFQSSCIILTSPTDCSNDSWRDIFFKKHEHGTLWLLICGAIEKHLLTYLPDGQWTPRACQSYNMTMVLTCGHDGQWMLKACQSYKLAMVLIFGSDSQWMQRACQSYNMTMVLTCGPDSK